MTHPILGALPLCRHGSVMMPGTFCPQCDAEAKGSARFITLDLRICDLIRDLRGREKRARKPEVARTVREVRLKLVQILADMEIESARGEGGGGG